MKTFYLTILFLGLSFCVQGQKSLNDYSYIIVNDQYEFQDQKDKYQLNSLIKYLYNKNGFHAFFNKDVPKNVKRCDGLFADAEGKPGFRVTKVTHVIKDCNGNEVFRSKEGKSGHKEFKNAYYIAAREAFESIIILKVNQKEIETFDIKAETPVEKEEISKAPETKINSSQTESSKTTSVVNSSAGSLAIANLPTSKYSNYSYNNNSYLLRKTNTGYNLYEEVNTDEELKLIGKLSFNNNVLYFSEKSKDPVLATFDEKYNLLIQSKNGLITYKATN